MSELGGKKVTNSKGKYKAKVGGKMTKEYITWRSMLARVYCPKSLKRSPHYIGCSIHEDWHDFQNFAEWYSNNKYSNHDYQLDKDLLIPGNKLYSPDTVCFIPQELNSLLTNCSSNKGKYLPGVYLNKVSNKFVAKVRINNKRKHLGTYDTELEAYQAYKTAKETNVKSMAMKWRGKIHPDAFKSLMQWELPT